MSGHVPADFVMRWGRLPFMPSVEPLHMETRVSMVRRTECDLQQP